MYAIDFGTPPPAAAASAGTTLRVLRVRVADQFSSREFHYLIAPNQHQPDYYANFVADPDHILTGQVIDWLYPPPT